VTKGQAICLYLISHGTGSVLVFLEAFKSFRGDKDRLGVWFACLFVAFSWPYYMFEHVIESRRKNR